MRRFCPQRNLVVQIRAGIENVMIETFATLYMSIGDTL